MVRTNGHGGALLLVPDGDEEWSSSIDSFGFCFESRDSSIPDSIRSELKRMAEYGKEAREIFQSDLPDTNKITVASNSPNDWVDLNAIDAIARLAAIDGEVVLTSSARSSDLAPK